VTTIPGIIHGKTIELERAPGLADGQAVAVTIQEIELLSAPPAPHDIPLVESWADRLVFDSTVEPIERIVKGTRLTAEALVVELEQGRSNEQMLLVHPELSNEDLHALRQYARWPAGLRRSCGAWEEDAEELDNYVEWTRQQRKIKRREIED
jgi:hypothetical protein